MKCHIVLLLVIGLNAVVSTSVLQKKVLNNSLLLGITGAINKNLKSPDSNETEQKSDMITVDTDSTIEEEQNYKGSLDIISENLENPTDEVDVDPASYYETNSEDSSGLNIDDVVPVRDEDYFYNDIINKDPNEILDTAAGFVPIPIFKRRNKHRKQVAARRRFREPYPYRRLYYFYPYYGYYRPSSLRFY